MKVITELTCQSLWQLQCQAKSPRIQRRFQIIRLAKEGLTGNAIADIVGLSRRRVQSWVSRFNQYGVEGLLSTPRSSTASPPNSRDAEICQDGGHDL